MPVPSQSNEVTEPTDLLIALTGNPNSGKTSLFNLLTGLRRKVGNYPGVTVDRVTGNAALADGTHARIVDVPGTYSLTAIADDERIARDVLLGISPGMERPDRIIAVLEASSVERGLFLVTQLMEMGIPMIVALTMGDLAKRRRGQVDPTKLERRLGLPVVPVNARGGEGLQELLARLPEARVPDRPFELPAVLTLCMQGIEAAIPKDSFIPASARGGEAMRLLLHARDDDPVLARVGMPLQRAVEEARDTLASSGKDREAVEAEIRYAFARSVMAEASETPRPAPYFSEKLDGILTQTTLGPIIFLVVMAIMFQMIFSWAEPFMGWIESGVAWAQETLGAAMGPGMLTDLMVDGVIAGVGNVIIFLPQICLLFLFLGVLEQVGYLSRAAFLVDRIMRGVGLSGKSFIPLMSSFACAIPGIMATRSIESRRDRMVTMLVAPFMSCAARLPVYILLVGAFIPKAYQGLTMWAMYVLSVVAALVAAWVLRKTVFKGRASTYVMELPAYRKPSWGHVWHTVWSKGKVFVVEAGTIILAFSIILWALAYFPRSDEIAQQAEARIEAGEQMDVVSAWKAGAQLEQSYMGRIGKAIEPAIEPLGFNWKVGVGLVASFAAREVLVSTLGVVYSVGEDADEESSSLRDKLKKDKRDDGSPAFNWLVALSLMVFFVLACQCMSTLAVVKRETGSWHWPLFMFFYMTIAAYLASLLVYQGGRALGWGG